MPQRMAITRAISSALAACELTHLERLPIDVEVARAQHDGYERVLAAAGYRVERLPADPSMPDSVFVEDIAIVTRDVAIVTRPGAASRRGEVPAIAAALGRYRALRQMEAPATLDGGDVLVADTRVFVGRSSRTNADGVAQLRRFLAPHGFSVCDVSVDGCLHLKSAVTVVAPGVLLVNPDWVDAAMFRDHDVVTIDPTEPYAANALRLHDRVMYPSAFVKTAARLAARGIVVAPVDVSELAKAEGAVTCCSLILDAE